jgi:hypothetical protein
MTYEEANMETLEKVRDDEASRMRAPQPPTGPMLRVANVFLRFLLRSPLHSLLSRNLLLLSYTGRKSGKRYTFPISYSRVGDVVSVFTYRAWERNLRGGAPVVVEIKRQRFEGLAEVIRDDTPAIASALLTHLQVHPSLARGYSVALDAAGQPDPAGVRQVAQSVALVRIRLIRAANGLPPE